MSLWAVKDADGWLWDFTDEGFYEENDTRTAGIPNRDYANQTAKEHNGTLTEYVQKSAPIVVSEAEAKMLKKAKDTTVWRPAAVISDYAYNAAKDSDQEALLEDRLMRAYVNGYIVANEKKYNVKVPHTKDVWYYKSLDKDLLTISDKELCSEFTEAEIEKYGLQDCEKEEVSDD